MSECSDKAMRRQQCGGTKLAVLISASPAAKCHASSFEVLVLFDKRSCMKALLARTAGESCNSLLMLSCRPCPREKSVSGLTVLLTAATDNQF